MSSRSSSSQPLQIAARRVVILFQRILFFHFILSTHADLEYLRPRVNDVISSMGDQYNTSRDVTLLPDLEPNHFLLLAIREANITDVGTAFHAITGLLASHENAEFMDAREVDAVAATAFRFQDSVTKAALAAGMSQEELSQSQHIEFQDELSSTLQLIGSWSNSFNPDASANPFPQHLLPSDEELQRTASYLSTPGINLEQPSETSDSEPEDLPNIGEPARFLLPPNILDYRTQQQFYLGKCDLRCRACGALHFEGESRDANNTYAMCCKHGQASTYTSFPSSSSHYLFPVYFSILQVALPRWPPFPSNLRKLYNGNDPLSHEFMRNIHRINMRLSMASFRTTTQLTPERLSPLVVR